MSGVSPSGDLLAGLTVEQLDTTVRIASLSFSSLPSCLHSLLQLAFFNDKEPAFQTISVAERTSITVVAEVAAIEKLASTVEDLHVDEVDWAVVRVGVGSEGQNQEMVGLVERLTEPLASAGIPVLYQSTYSTEYVLIPRNQLEQALECLAALAYESLLPWDSNAPT